MMKKVYFLQKTMPWLLKHWNLIWHMKLYVIETEKFNIALEVVMNVEENSDMKFPELGKSNKKLYVDDKEYLENMIDEMFKIGMKLK